MHCILLARYRCGGSTVFHTFARCVHCRMSVNAAIDSTAVAATVVSVMARNAAIPRDRQTEVADSSGSRRRRLPDIPPRNIAAENRICGFNGNRRDLTAATDQNGDGDGRTKSSSSSNVDEIQSQSTGSRAQSATGVSSDDKEERRAHSFGCVDKQMRTIANATDRAFIVEGDQDLFHVEELRRTDDGDRRTRGSGGQHPGTSSYRPSLFALVGACRFVAVTLEIPQSVSGDDVADDVIRLTVADASGVGVIAVGGNPRPLSGMHHGGIPSRSAFKPVGHATKTTRLDNADDDRSLVTVSIVRRDILPPRCSQQLLPGDILLEVQTLLTISSSMISNRIVNI